MQTNFFAIMSELQPPSACFGVGSSPALLPLFLGALQLHFGLPRLARLPRFAKRGSGFERSAGISADALGD